MWSLYVAVEELLDKCERLGIDPQEVIGVFERAIGALENPEQEEEQ